MFFNPIRSERGTGIIQILAALLIVSAAIAGLFISSYYVRYRADANYHYRVALLKASQKLEEIKWRNMFNSGTVILEGINTGSFVIENKEENDIIGQMTLSWNRSMIDRWMPIYIAYDEVMVKVEWQSSIEGLLNNQFNKKQEVVLREDYYYRTDQPTGGTIE